MTPRALDKAYADNEFVTVAERINAEVADNHPDRLWIASGYLAVTVWDSVGRALESIGDFRLLLGKDWQSAALSAGDESADIATLVKQAIQDESQPPRLPDRMDAEIVAAFVRFLEGDNVQVKAWRGDGFLHAKAYLFDRSVGVGSANFTFAGFNTNRELVMWREDRPVVSDIADWFLRYWDDPESMEYKAELVDALRATRLGGALYTPYDVLIRALADRYGLERPPSLEQATFSLKWFQTDAVYRLIRLVSGPARGALLADAVGLGKTFMALGVAHHFLHQSRTTVRGRPVLLVIPASLRRTWEQVLDAYNLSWACDIVHVQHLRGDFDATRYTGAELVIIDEAHRLRGGGVWFDKLVELLRRSFEGGADPRVLLLTATPVNTSMADLTNLLRVLTKNRRNIWAPDIPDFERYLKRVERSEADPYPLLDRCVVRRSRSDVINAYEERRQTEPTLEQLELPTRRLAHEAYQYDTHGSGEVFAVFATTITNLRLAPYDIERFRRPEQDQLFEPDDIPSSTFAGLYVTGLLKRFESSVRAVMVSLRRLQRVQELFAAAIRDTPPRLLSLSRNPELRRLLDAEVRADDDDESADALATRIDELVGQSPVLDEPEAYDLAAILHSVDEDMAAIDELIESIPPEAYDGKINAVLDLLTRQMAGPRVGLAGRRVLVFSQFRDTAIYLGERLNEAAKTNPAVGRVAVLHGGSTPTQRDEIAATFDPAGPTDILDSTPVPRILVSTDILAEGHNLQLAEAVVNYDLHWNPQVAVQRSGRVDRLNSPHDTVYLVSFLPEDGLDQILGLVDRLNERFSLYKHLGLADEPVTKLSSDQVVGMSLEQLRRIYADDNNILDDIERSWTFGSTDYMRAPLEAFLRSHAEEAVKSIPQGVQSAKLLPRGWEHGAGVFIAFQHGEGDTSEAFWRFYRRLGNDGWQQAEVDDTAIYRAIACTPHEIPVSELGDLDPQNTSTPGVLIDWSLLNVAARRLADELTARRTASQVLRGASERSARLRTRLLDVTGNLELAELDPLLDRLEQVRIEDYDAASGYEPFMDRIRRAERTDVLAERVTLLRDIAERGIALLGDAEDESAGSDVAIEVRPADLKLTAWEILVERATVSSEQRGLFDD
jgi:superfamily II DNA or RNA helicase